MRSRPLRSVMPFVWRRTSATTSSVKPIGKRFATSSQVSQSWATGSSLNPPAASSAERRISTELGLRTTLWIRSSSNTRPHAGPRSAWTMLEGRMSSSHANACAATSAASGWRSRCCTPTSTRFGSQASSASRKATSGAEVTSRPALRAWPAPPRGRLT